MYLIWVENTELFLEKFARRVWNDKDFSDRKTTVITPRFDPLFADALPDYMEYKFPQIGRWSFAEACNSVFKESEEEYFILVNPAIDTDYLIAGCMDITRHALQEVGLFSHYLKSPYWVIVDWIFRKRLLDKEFPLTYEQSLFPKPSSSMSHAIEQNQFNILWEIPLEVPAEDFARYVAKNHEVQV